MQQTVLTDFRPVFILMLGILIIFFILSLIGSGQNRGISFGMILTVSIIQFLVAGVLFYIESNLVENLNLTADNITLYMFVAILVLSIVNPLIYKLRAKNTSSRYRYRRF